jgi:hypothetical protein
VAVSAGGRGERIALICAIVLPIVITTILIPFRATLPSAVAVLLLVTVVVAVAANGYRGAGLLAAVSAAVWFDFFLTRPYEQFAITRRADVETTVLMVLVGALVTELAVRGRRHREVAATKAGYLASISTTAGLVVSRASPSEVIALVNDQLTVLLDLQACRFELGRFGGMPVMDADGQLHSGTTTWDVDHDGMPAEPIELRAHASSQAVGRFVLTFKPGATSDRAAPGRGDTRRPGRRGVRTATRGIPSQRTRA